MSPTALYLLALHDSVNETEALASQLRNAGISAHVRQIEELDQLREVLLHETPELILHLIDLPEPRLAEVIALAHGHIPPIPVLGMSASYSLDGLLACIREGARDLIDLTHPSHVQHVIRREAEAVACARRLQRVEGLYQESERRCHALMKSSRDAIAYVHGGMHVSANPVYLETFGFERIEDLEGSPLLDLIQPEDQARLRDFLRRQEEAHAEGELADVKFRRKDGSSFSADLELSFATIEGEPCLQVLIRTEPDIHQLEEQINFLSQRDLMTGLYNRQYFFTRLEDALAKARAGGQPGALIHIQITNVPELKERLGVAGLDILITDAGKLIEKLVGPDILLSRYSAHAFAMLVPVQGEGTPEDFARRIVNGLTQHIFEVDGKSVTLQVAAGLALLDQDTPSVNELLNRAERATLEAQDQGVDHVVLYTPRPGEVSQAELDEQWSRRLREALHHDRLRLVYQPMLSLQGDTSRQRYEVFLRLLDERDQPISPYEFMAAAERTKISHALDRWVILNALKAIAEARQRGLNVQLFVRLSSRTVADPAFPDWLGERLMAMQIHDGSLALEVDENVAIENLKPMQDLQRRLQALQCPLLLDGFGLGEDPFRALNYLQVQWLRIHRALMESFAKSKANQAKVRELIQAIKRRGGEWKLVVPNVEDAISLQIVLAEGADFVQGNFIQPPVERLDFDFTAF